LSGEGAQPVYADFVDGTDAVTHRVSLQLSRTHLHITLPEGETLYWALEDLRALPDQAYADGLVLSDGHAGTARLVIDNPHVARELRGLAPNLSRSAPVGNWGRIFGWAGGALTSVAVIIFVLVPIMADQLATYLPPEGERALGDATFEQIRGALGREAAPVRLCEAPAGRAALDAMMARLDPSADLPYDVRLAVLDHDLVNAFALPGGRVILFRGLIEEAESADEVASILAHEVGHVVNRDPTRDALRSAGSIGVLGLLFGDFAGGTVVLLLANQLINAKYSQAAEAAADDYAHDLMREAEVDPGALGRIFARLLDEYGDAEGIMAHFASHPQMVDRIEAAQAAAEGGVYDRPVITDAEWQDLREICGPRAAQEDSDSPGAQDDTDGRLGGRN
jgi:Zn-dependent protease with chaperone function